MRRFLFWLVIVPALVSVAVFAFNNRSTVAIDLWPFGLTIEMPVYLAFLLTLGAGVVLGGFVSWLGQSGTRARLREQTYQGEVARRELAAQREKTARLERTSQTPKINPAPELPAHELKVSSGHDVEAPLRSPLSGSSPKR